MILLRYSLLLFLICTLTGCATPKKGPSDMFEYEQEAFQNYNDGKYEEAIEKYEHLVQEVPKDPTLWFRLANSYAKNSDPDQAINAYRNTLLRDPRYEKAWYNMGVIQMQLALKTFIEMQQNIAPGNPVRERAVLKMNGLMDLLGQNADNEKQNVSETK